MLRKIMIAFALAALGLVAASGVATAYPADAVPAVAVDDVLFAPGDSVEFSGVGFTPGETVDVQVTYGAGLRAGQVGIASLKLAKLTTVADSLGRFSTPITLTQVGTATITATGLTSGVVLSKTVTITADGLAYTGADGDDTDGGTTVTDDGLAYTGTSLAGPLAIGGGALVAGLVLLFFGTRMAIRRKNHSAS